MSKARVPSLSQQVNSASDGGVDEDVLNDLLDTMHDAGWIEVEMPDGGFNFRGTKQRIIPGDRVRYVCLDPEDDTQLFRTGGWILQISADGEHLVYRSHARDRTGEPVNFSLQASSVVRLWIIHKKPRKPKEPKVKPEPVSYFRRPEEPPGKFASYLVDKDGVSHFIRNSANNTRKREFESSQKFQRALKTKEWIWD